MKRSHSFCKLNSIRSLLPMYAFIRHTCLYICASILIETNNKRSFGFYNWVQIH